MTVGVTLTATDLSNLSADSRGATTAWRLMEGAGLLYGQSSHELVRDYQLGLNSPKTVLHDGLRLFVADRNNNRVRIYRPIPGSNQPAPAVVLGQPDPGITGPDCDGLSARSLNSPGGVCSDGRRLYVSDIGNNRVLIWDPIPTTHFAPATVVLGQPDFQSNTANNGGRTAKTLSTPAAASTPTATRSPTPGRERAARPACS